MGLDKMRPGNSNMAQSLMNLDLTGFAVGGAASRENSGLSKLKQILTAVMA